MRLARRRDQSRDGSTENRDTKDRSADLEAGNWVGRRAEMRGGVRERATPNIDNKKHMASTAAVAMRPSP
jgi:hypothetical protein